MNEKIYCKIKNFLAKEVKSEAPQLPFLLRKLETSNQTFCVQEGENSSGNQKE